LDKGVSVYVQLNSKGQLKQSADLLKQFDELDSVKAVGFNYEQIS
jgi:hypothetical protein